MPKLHRSDRFINEVKMLMKKGVLTLEQVKQLLQLPEENLQCSFLKINKIQGTDEIFEGWLTMTIRVTFEYVKPDAIYLRNVGEYDQSALSKV